ncbi:helix-turn-helix domain-containing protein [Sedimentibacter sp. MB31-C6]|uniref:helix-turn-helix domain-containing protein n=1 Tax=Sedimentibacter sp. MB31-C6 TaxID=3109366 RepID=UPI002DDDAFCB|nr:helix-turn-helix domain-containing protein [Sedimentibacter sp. MB36-C1]WSI04650.1 helix-turn-helix domain-containing protein [Sedimentibacter sp. MB36-C1]
MLSVIEKEIAIESSQNYFSGTQGKLLFKIISNYLENTSELRDKLKDINESIFSDEYKMQTYSKIIIEYMADVAMKPKSNITYTTGQLARIFGVSITTINNWIREGRFVGVESKEKNKQSRISENTLWESSNGEQILIKEITELYEKHKVENVSKEEEQKILKDEIEFFENKYNGKYNETLLNKKDKTEEELLDESEWKYLLKRVKKC